MKLLVVNPLGHDRYDSSDAEFLARRLARGDTVSVVSLPSGPDFVHDFVALGRVAHQVADVVAALAPGHDAVVINCFADPGLEAAREASPVPVLGPGRTCLALARLISRRFGLVAAGGRSLAVVQRNLELSGLGDGLVGVEALDIPVEALGRDPARTTARIVAAARRLVSRGAGCIVLGCTGMARLAAGVAARVPVPLLEPLTTTAGVARALVRLGLSHARAGTAGTPGPWAADPPAAPAGASPPPRLAARGGLDGRGRTLLVINPVTWPDLVPRVKAYLGGLVAPGTRVRVEALRTGPQFIESARDTARAVPGLLDLVAELAGEADASADCCGPGPAAGATARREGFRPDAVVINCYADPGLEPVREAAGAAWGAAVAARTAARQRVPGGPGAGAWTVPVVGLGVASSVVAALLARRFCVVAVGAGGAAQAREQVRALGLGPLLAGVVEARLGVDELLCAPQQAGESLADGVRRALREPGSEAVAFGCGGVMDLVAGLRGTFPGTPLVEPLAAAVGVAEVLADLYREAREGAAP